MRASARVVAVHTDGTTRLPVLCGQPPLLLRRTGPHGAVAVVYLVGGAAGPLGGDDLRLTVDVGPGARLVLRSVAAAVALPGPGNDASQIVVEATVAAGDRLDWRPEPLVAAAGCRHRARSQVTLAEGAELTWQEALVCGRHGEQPGEATVALTVTYAGRPLYQQESTVGTHAPGWAGPAVLDGARAVGSTLYVRPAWAKRPPEPVVLSPTAAVTPLAGPGALATALGPDTATVGDALANAARHLGERDPLGECLNSHAG